MDSPKKDSPKKDFLLGGWGSYGTINKRNKVNF